MRAGDDAMKPRPLRIDFAGVPLAWSSNAEFAWITNSGSPLTSAVEPYLNIVMSRVRDALPESHGELKRQVDIFIRQEACHYRLHDSFNRELYAAGYPGLKALADQLKADLREMLERRSLLWNLAYCTAFENLATFMAKFWFGRADDLFEDGDPRGIALMKWHMAEEFEHRTVCHSALTALSGNYVTRVRGLIDMMRHLTPYKKKAVAIVLGQERAGMTPGQLAHSIAREKAFNRRFEHWMMRQLVGIFRPWYDPADHPTPKGVPEALAAYEEIAASPEPANGEQLAPAVAW
jgi:predicted metal-dependent hydrolase